MDMVQVAHGLGEPPGVQNVGPSQKSIDEGLNDILVWKSLAPFLSLSDLKCIRQTSSGLNWQILHNKNFNDRVTVNILADRVKPTIFGRSRHPWKSFMVPYEGQNPTEYDQNDPLDWFYPLLKSAETLTIFAKTCNQQENPSVTHPPLEKLLKAPTNLKTLKVHTNILNASETPPALTSLFSSAQEEGENAFKNLTEFHLLSPGPIYSTLEQKIWAKKAFQQSTKLFGHCLRNLELIQIDCLSPSPRAKDLNKFEADVQQEGLVQQKNGHLVNLIFENRETLKRVHVLDFYLWTRSRPPPAKNDFEQGRSIFDPTMIFPHLTSLGILIHTSECENLIQFLRRQPHLHQLLELDLTVYNKFPNDLLTLIGGQTTGLKRLRIRTKGFEQEVNNWGFLKGLKNLTDFQLSMTNSVFFDENCGDYLGKIIVQNLPKTIKKIYIKSHKGRHDGHLMAKDFKNIDPQNLTHLTLKAPSLIDDGTMEYICKNFKMLQHLDVTSSTGKCTDFGFTGISKKEKVGESSKFSLKDLKGLKSLSLHCEKLTDLTLVNAIRFKELKYLYLALPKPDDNEDVTEAGIEAVIKRNPSLEIFKTVNEDELCDFPTLTQMKRWNPRIQRHISRGEYDPTVQIDGYESDHWQSYRQMMGYASEEEDDDDLDEFDMDLF